MGEASPQYQNGDNHPRGLGYISSVLDSCTQLDEIVHSGRNIVLDGHSLDLSSVVAISLHKIAADITDSQTVLSQLERSVDLLAEKLENGEVIYGVTTGFGGSADTRTNDYAALQQALIQHHHSAVVLPGDRESGAGSTRLGFLKSHAMPIPIVKAAMLIRCNSLLRAHSAVRIQVIRNILALLAHDMTPVVPLRGSISACGDLTPLAYICGAIEGNPDIAMNCGEGQNHRIIPASQALQEAGLTPLEFGPKEGLGLLNGTAFSSGAATLVLFEANQLAILSKLLTAMGTEALLGSRYNYHPFIAEARPHPGQLESAAFIFECLAGSKLVRGADPDGEGLAQDRYALRTSTQWIGPQLENLALALEQVQTELNSTTDNPLLDLAEERVHHGGNFQAAAITSAMEKTMGAMQMLGKMIFSQCSEILNPMLNKGLPPNLSADDPSLSFAFKGVDINMASYMSELAYLNHPVSNHVQSAEMHNQSLNSLALIAARYAGDTVELLALMSATYLYVLCQALDLRAMHLEFVSQARKDVDNANAQLFQSSGAGAQLSHSQEIIWKELMSHWERNSTSDLHKRSQVTATDSLGAVLDLLGDQVVGKELRQWKSNVANILETRYGANRKLFFQSKSAAPYLCNSSQKLYGFVRQSIGVAMHRGLVDHPAYDSGEKIVKESIGSNIGKIYAALRAGEFREVILGCCDIPR
ncbi:Phenylalanine ammonia-lyase [Penicillium samsonianum]|uniref:Phenylalanine ammonia-lyase n=1 Tax=Penicillium samsonianum TaxID=1882272 RepID=UPI002547361D|nr:Phenylalanine ammonia-lyase [Penicillium samsonianum]KAJ6133163.1 Phenylalanine ammonia-lyase [Penicillium samsonianum]